ncbi:MAG: ROK family protein [Edaphocola sp.]
MHTKSFSIGMDIGGTNIAFGIVNRHGDILKQHNLKTADYGSPQIFVEALKGYLGEYFSEFGKDEITGIGIGAPNGNIYTGNIEHAPNLVWKGTVPLAEMVTQAVGLPVTVTNDANATAIGEMTYGAAKGMKDFLVITLGTGVGSGFVANGQLIYGHDGFAGELGHTIAIRGGRHCGCGRKGCLETYTSATGIVRTAMELLENAGETNTEHPDWLANVNARNGKVASADIHKAAVAGDPLALEIFEFTGKILGQSLADAVAITSPEAIILFGGLAKAGTYIIGPTKRHMEENLLYVYQNKIDIMPSGLSERDAAILGSASLVW